LAAHWASLVQATHVLAWQIGLAAAAVHSAVTLHSTQAPIGPHTGRAAASMAQVCPAGAMLQGTHLLPAQNGLVGSLQWLAAVHSTQVPPVSSHTAVGALQVPAGAPAQPHAAVATQKPLPVVVHWRGLQTFDAAPFDPQYFLSPPFIAQLSVRRPAVDALFVDAEAVDRVAAVGVQRAGHAAPGRAHPVCCPRIRWSPLQVPGASGPGRLSAGIVSGNNAPSRRRSPPSPASGPSTAAPVLSGRASPASVRAMATQR
jgi:hypothetical protein